MQGYANEQLGSLSYDISNAAGVDTNQPGYVIGQSFDPNVFVYTTNFFQCYDMPLTNKLDTPTIARVMPVKIKRWNDFSATNQVKARQAPLFNEVINVILRFQHRNNTIAGHEISPLRIVVSAWRDAEFFR